MFMIKPHKISIVIPMFNESRNIGLLAKEIDCAMKASSIDFECIWVDDGSTDSSWLEVLELNGNHRGIKLSRNSGQATAMMAGIENAKSEIIVTMDSDLQNDPNDIIRLLEKLTDEFDVVCGVRKSRQDKLFTRKIPSLFANFLARKMSGVPVSDLGCTLRVFRSHLVSTNRIIGEMHRLLVVYFHLEGARITEIEVNHRARIHGESKYGLERFFKFIADLILASGMNYIMRKPLYLFGSMALASFTFGAISLASAIFLRVFGVKAYIDTSLVTGSMILMSTSLILISIGLLSELVIRQMLFTGTKPQYTIVAKKSQ